MDLLFEPPDEFTVRAISQTFPCREPQIRSLSSLLCTSAAPCGNIVVYGTNATGKTAITRAVLERLPEAADGPRQDKLKYAIVNCRECITGRHLFETIVEKMAHSLGRPGRPPRCENISQLTVELSNMLLYPPLPADFRFVVVLDAIDRQREAPQTLLSALARISEYIPKLTSVFIVTSPPAGFLRTSFVPHIRFPNYSKTEFVEILSLTPPATLPTTTDAETAELWSRFVSTLHDTLGRSAIRSLPVLRHACHALWPRFTAPILAGSHGPREFSKLVVAARTFFQDESLLNPGVLTARGAGYRSSSLPDVPIDAVPEWLSSGTKSHTTQNRSLDRSVPTSTPDLARLLPTTARLVLVAAYLASHNPPRHDLTLFSTFHHGRRRRRGGRLSGAGRGRGSRTKHRKIARKLLGAHAFVLERMLAIFAALSREWDGNGRMSVAGTPLGTGHVSVGIDADVGMAIGTLASLRLLIRVGAAGAGGDPLDRGGKWRVNVDWEIIRGLGRSMGLEVEEWLVE